MNLIDSHTHLYLDEFENDRDHVVKMAVDAGVSKLLLPNVDVATLSDLLSLVKNYPENCFPMIGLHPTSVKGNFRKDLDLLESEINQHDFIAIGETGIDLYWDKTFRAEQEESFRIQLEWAMKYKLPVVIHARESFKEIYVILDQFKNSGIQGVFHSFTGTEEDVKKIMEYDFYFGINGILTYKNAGLASVVKSIPLDRILLETDSPFLAPVPKRGKRNESSYLVYIAEKLEEILDLRKAEIDKLSTENAKRLFKI
jgi:TatD DNase family protein